MISLSDFTQSGAFYDYIYLLLGRISFKYTMVELSTKNVPRDIASDSLFPACFLEAKRKGEKKGKSERF